MAGDSAQALVDLGALGAALSQASGRVGESEKIKELILEKIATLDKETAKALFQDPKVQELIESISDDVAQSPSDPPGSIRDGWIGSTRITGFTKRDWTEQDLAKAKDRQFVTFTPTETLPIFWNGLRRQLIADEEITIEKCFKDIYDQHRVAIRQGREHAAFLFKQRSTISDPMMVTAEGARARGTGETGWYVPGGGSIAMDQRAAPATEGEGSGE